VASEPEPEAPDLVAAVEAVLRAVGHDASVDAVLPLTGGASRETHRVEATRSGQPWPLVLQRERAGVMRRSGGMATEADVVMAALAAGVPAPQVIATNRADISAASREALGPSFFVTEAVDGETIARRILRDEEYTAARLALPRQMAAAAAAIHRTPTGALSFLDEIDELTRYRAVADELGLVSPAFELAFRWLEQHRPVPSTGPTLVHGDLRLGNLIVDRRGLAAVIDWELAHIGDPMEDLGWLCVRAWRFGGPGLVAGVGTYDDFFGAYESESGVEIDPEAVRWWQVLGTLRWGVMCGMQANVHLSGQQRSVELAAIGRRIPEQEYDVLRLLT